MADEIYSTEATSSRGSVRVDGRGDLAYAVGEPGDGTADPLNPERLYAAALATCLHQSLTIAATSWRAAKVTLAVTTLSPASTANDVAAIVSDWCRQVASAAA